MSLRAVIDAMYWARGFVPRHVGSHAEELIRAWREGRFDAFFSGELVAEVEGTLRELGVPMDVVRDLIWEMCSNPQAIIPIHHQVMGLDDEDDNHLVEVALNAGAQYIVTEDSGFGSLSAPVRSLFERHGIKVVSAMQFMRELRFREGNLVIYEDIEHPQPPFSCLVCNHADHADADCGTCWDEAGELALCACPGPGSTLALSA